MKDMQLVKFWEELQHLIQSMMPFTGTKLYHYRKKIWAVHSIEGQILIPFHINIYKPTSPTSRLYMFCSTAGGTVHEPSCIVFQTMKKKLVEISFWKLVCNYYVSMQTVGLTARLKWSGSRVPWPKIDLPSHANIRALIGGCLWIYHWPCKIIALHLRIDVKLITLYLG